MEFSKYIIVGSGIFGAVLAERIVNVMKENVTIIEKRNHIGGNCYSKIDQETGIEYHQYGTHIFHTSDPVIWKYIHHFTEFNAYRHQVLTTHKSKVYQMPINLETINSFYGLNLCPSEADAFLMQEAAKAGIQEPSNFEEKAIATVGQPLYEAFIKGYTMKQWQRHPSELPVSLLNRLPFRTDYNENYFHDKWQGIPEDGYTAFFNKLLSSPKIDICLNTDFFDLQSAIPVDATLIYTGSIDRYYHDCFGRLEWRSLEFEREVMPVKDFQGTSVMNFADFDVPHTRIHEPKHLHPERVYPSGQTLIIKEYPAQGEPYYPVNDQKNQSIYIQYRKKADNAKKVYFGGRMGEYKYMDMHQSIASALDLFETIRQKKQ